MQNLNNFHISNSSFLTVLLRSAGPKKEFSPFYWTASLNTRKETYFQKNKRHYEANKKKSCLIVPWIQLPEITRENDFHLTYFYPAIFHTEIKVTGSITVEWPHNWLCIMGPTGRPCHWWHILVWSCPSPWLSPSPQKPKIRLLVPKSPTHFIFFSFIFITWRLITL